MTPYFTTGYFFCQPLWALATLAVRTPASTSTLIILIVVSSSFVGGGERELDLFLAGLASAVDVARDRRRELRRLAVEHDRALAHADDPVAVILRRLQQVQVADDGNPVLLVDAPE